MANMEMDKNKSFGKMKPASTKCYAFWILLLYWPTVSNASQPPEVWIGEARLVGRKIYITENDVESKIDEFLGIPYVEPMGKNERFKYSKLNDFPEPRFVEVDKQKPICTQIDCNYTEMSEDCLYMDIYRPYGIRSGYNYGVVIKFHGGSYVVGSGRLSPGQFLASRDIIVVVPNYRLGALGYFAMDGTEYEGNYGFFDQVNAVKWVHKYIYRFGGNPNQITLLGESAGAISVQYLSLNSQLRDIVKGVISVSGSMLADPAFSRYTSKQMNKVARDNAAKLGKECNTTNFSKMIQCYLIANAVAVQKTYNPDLRLYYSPRFHGVKKVTPNNELPLDILKQCKVNTKQKHFIGITTDDFYVLFGNSQPIALFQYILQNASNDRIDAIYRNFEFFKNSTINSNMTSSQNAEVLHYISMKAPIIMAAALLAKCGVDVYFYQFNVNLITDKNGLVAHGLDLPYYFGYPFMQPNWQEIPKNETCGGITDAASITYHEKYKELDDNAKKKVKRMSSYMMDIMSNFVKAE